MSERASTVRGGWNRKTRKQKRLAGTLRRDREQGLSVPPGVPQPPQELTGEAKRKWTELLDQLAGKGGVLSRRDASTLALACMHWSVAVAAWADVEQHGVMLRGARGHRAERVKNPALQVFRDHSSAFSAIAARFGLTPADRGRVHPAEDEADDLFP